MHFLSTGSNETKGVQSYPEWASVGAGCHYIHLTVFWKGQLIKQVESGAVPA